MKVPTLPSEGTATLYMYYNNPTATTTSSSTQTFIAADDFEDGNINEYTGANDDKNLFSVNTNHVYGGTYGLDNNDDSGLADDGGMARFDQTVSQGETIRYMQKISTNGSDDEVCTMFGVQSPITNNLNYGVCLEQSAGSEFIAIVEDVVYAAEPSNIIASTTVTYSDGWYEVEIDWGTDNTIFVSLYDDQENLVATTSATDASKTSGGYGFTYWYNEGGWDNFTSRPTLATEPTIRFGAEATDGGATWLAAQDTVHVIAAEDTVRLRLSVENSGLSTTTDLVLKYAAKGAAPSCESVSSANYDPVPVQSSCGSSPICMQTTANYANGAATVDLLSDVNGTFVAGKAVEDPSNSSGNVTIDQNEYSEFEFAVTPTVNAVDTNYCLRAGTENGSLDTYLSVAEMEIKFDPLMGVVYMDDLDGLNDINLVPGTTTRVYATTTVTDYNGYTDLVAATSTFYHSDETAACVEDPNSCYVETTAGNCSFTNCSGNSCVLQCYADFYYFASSTDNFGGKFWYAFMEAEDTQGGVDFDTSSGQDVTTLNALEVNQTIDYGSLTASSTTGTNNATSTISNIGNNSIDINLEGIDLTDGGSSIIPVSEQKFSTTTFNYDACVNCVNLSTTTIPNYELDLIKPTSTSTPVTDDVYWGIRIPFGTASNPHTGVNTFYAVSD